MPHPIIFKPVQNSKQNNRNITGVKMLNNEKEGLRDLLIVEMRDIYWGEKALAKAMPYIIENAATRELEDALTSHLFVTKKNITLLEEVFYSIGEEAVGSRSEAVTELIRESYKILEESEIGKVRDVRIISEERKIELHKITTYGVLSYFAKRLGEKEANELLEEILREEKEADIVFLQIREFFINTAEAVCAD